MPAIFHLGVNGVNAIRRKDEAGDGDVGRGRAESATESIAFNYFSSHGVSAAEHLRSVIQIAGANALADACAADGLAVEREGGETVHLKFKFRAKFAQQF